MKLYVIQGYADSYPDFTVYIEADSMPTGEQAFEAILNDVTPTSRYEEAFTYVDRGELGEAWERADLRDHENERVWILSLPPECTYDEDSTAECKNGECNCESDLFMIRIQLEEDFS